MGGRSKSHMPWKEKDQHKIPIPDGVKNAGGYRNLMNQVNKVARHNRQGSYKTRDRYYQAVERFSRHLADKFNVQKFSNISGRHVASYVEHMQAKGLSASAIKTDLSAIRFFHDKFEKTRYHLPANQELKERFNVDLERRSFGGVDRSWSGKEYHGMVQHAENLGRHDIASIMQLAREQGLRLHEVTRLDRAAAEKALRTNELTVKGKGGLVRTIPLREEAKSVLENAMQNVDRGDKLFVPQGMKTDQVMRSVQTFIAHHRDQFSKANRESSLHFHGLRHSYAREEYQTRIEKGVSEKEARLEVSELIGHSREDVTNIYI